MDYICEARVSSNRNGAVLVSSGTWTRPAWRTVHPIIAAYYEGRTSAKAVDLLRLLEALNLKSARGFTDDDT